MTTRVDWTIKAWAYSQNIYQAITQLDFIQELVNGTLPKCIFTNYIEQDALYLKEYGEVLLEISKQLVDDSHREHFQTFALDTVAVEKVLHSQYVQNLSVRNEASPSNMLYTSFLWKQIASGKIHLALAAVLPCFWIYKEVGDYILAQEPSKDNPYQDWIDTYGGEAFAQSVEIAKGICNEIAAQCTDEEQQEMLDAYRFCSKMEWLFWQSAYEMDRWRI